MSLRFLNKTLDFLATVIIIIQEARMKIGDSVVCGGREGQIIRFQPKTQDIVVKDSDGKVHIFSSFSTQLKSENK